MAIIKNPEREKPRLNVVEVVTKQPLSILLVDTDENSFLKARHVLKDLPIASLKVATKAETASASAAAEHFDLVVVDPVVPDSLTLLKEIKDKYRWTATLVVTSDQTPQLMRQVVKCRIDGILFRPLTAEEFLEQVLLLAKAVRVSRQRQQRRVLAIGAHPDDVEIGCGGTLARHNARGDELHILTLSRGSSGGDVNVRATEANRAADLLGAKLRLANLQDAHISEGVKTIEIIEAVIKEVQPTHVYTHSVEDTHQDHRAVHAASLVAARSVPNFFSYQSPSSTVDFRPRRFVDITHFIGQKLKLIDAYHSQVDRMDSIQSDVTVATARYWGRFAGYVLAEPLKVIRERDTDPTPGSGTNDSVLGFAADMDED
ncbi:MAG TPA: PIG-L deacetylase family protein [Burkholderiaceae bacterium]|nr:PIG-L deacetylase family protein [Burkholderiaceae bacterium]